MNNENKNEDKPLLKAFSFGISQLEAPVERINNGGWIDYTVDIKGKKWQYPEYLIDLANRSSRHSSILKRKAEMIGSNGFMKGGLTPQTIDFLKNNTTKHNLDQILKKISYDYVLFSAYALQIILNKGRKSIATIDYISVASIRIAAPDPDYPDREDYYVCDDWNHPNKNPPVFYAGFSDENRDEEHTILYVKSIHGDYHNKVYGVPTYTGGINWIEMDYENSVYKLNGVQKGFHPSMLINFNMEPGTDQAEKAIRSLRNEYEGANGSKVIFTFADRPENAPKITPIVLNDNDSNFKDTCSEIEIQIFQAHEVLFPAIFGVLQPGKLANTNDLLDQLKLYQSMYLDYKQNEIAETFNKLAEVNGIPDKLTIEKYNLHLEVQYDIKDIMLVLMSTISNEQKVQVLEAVGYTRDQALALCPLNAPQPTAPVPIQPVKP